MEFTKKESYIKQTILYLNNKNYTAALGLAKKFTEKFPDEMVAHFLLAKSAFWSRDYELSLRESLVAFNKSEGNDRVPCALLAGCSYYQLGRYRDGYKFITAAKLPANEEVEQMRLIFSIFLENSENIEKHAEKLLALNEESAKRLLARFIIS
jgi:hypothetical protein